MLRYVSSGAVLLALMLSTQTPDNDRGIINGWTTSVNTDSVVIGGTQASDGSDNSSQSSQPWPPTAEEILAEQCAQGGLCRGLFSVVSIPDATLDDLASFAPAPAPLGGEPAGLGVVGLPTNFVVAAAEHTATGSLFDLPVTVRFTPVGATIRPGDGATIASDGVGRTWASLGAGQFSPTATSHTYRARGVYTATATVRYAAAVDFGTGWREVAGTLAIPTAGYRVEVREVRSALVELTCLENPSGPGCD